VPHLLSHLIASSQRFRSFVIRSFGFDSSFVIRHSNFPALSCSLLAIALILSACTVHPPGEAQERAAALKAGRPYSHPLEGRDLPTLTPDSSPEQLAAYAQLSSPDLEQKYWQWRSALEQVPQDATQKSGLMISLSSMINNGKLAWDTTTLAAGNDPMANLVLPNKLATSGAAALEQAKAAGLRFDKSRLDLRSKVLTAYAEYALDAELARLETNNIDLLTLLQKITESRLKTSNATQAQLLKTVGEVELAKNDLAARQATFPRHVAELNALLDRPANTPIAPPKKLQADQPLALSEPELLQAAARNTPGLQAQTHDIAAAQLSIKRAKQEYIPDFTVTAGTDLQGMAQSLMGSIVIPAVRYQALDAAIRQAKANTAAAAAMRRQAQSDLAAKIVTDVAALSEAGRQIDVFEKNILPRLEKIVTATQHSYSTGQATLPDLLDAQRSLIAIRRSLAEMHTERTRRMNDLESLAARPITEK